MGSRRRRLFVAVGVALLGALVAGVVWMRHPSSGIRVEGAPACIGDKVCARERARVLQHGAASAPSSKNEAIEDAMEALGETSACLAAAYDRADCEAASELIGGIERYPLDRTQQPNLTRMIDDVIRGHFGFCALATGASYDPPPPGSMIRLDRLGCGGGSCPIYGVTVDSEGHVVWEGKIFVDTMGHAERTISVQRARELFDAFERLSFAKGPHSFESNAEDARRARLTLIRGPMHHTFDDDDVNSTGAIRTGIAYLERRVDEIAQTAGWVSARDARAR